MACTVACQGVTGRSPCGALAEEHKQKTGEDGLSPNRVISTGGRYTCIRIGQISVRWEGKVLQILQIIVLLYTCGIGFERACDKNQKTIISSNRMWHLRHPTVVHVGIAGKYRHCKSIRCPCRPHPTGDSVVIYARTPGGWYRSILNTYNIICKTSGR